MFKNVYNGEMDIEIPKAVYPRVMAELMEQDKDVVYLDADLMNSIGCTGLPGSIPVRHLTSACRKRTWPVWRQA